MNAKQKWPNEITKLQGNPKDWARRILERENSGELFAVTVIDMAKRALNLTDADKIKV